MGDHIEHPCSQCGDLTCPGNYDEEKCRRPRAETRQEAADRQSEEMSKRLFDIQAALLVAFPAHGLQPSDMPDPAMITKLDTLMMGWAKRAKDAEERVKTAEEALVRYQRGNIPETRPPLRSEDADPA